MATTPTPLPTGTTLRSGESAPQATPAIIKSKPVKTYHHMVRGAKFVMPDGLEVQFLGGSFTTADTAIMEQLDLVANKPASMIYTKAEVVEAVKALTAAAAADAVQHPAKAE
jgi:hypothetical protein